MSERVKGSEGACDLIVASIWLGINPVSRPNSISTSRRQKEQPTEVDEENVVSLADTAVDPSSGITAGVTGLHSKLKARRCLKGKHLDGVDRAYSITLTWSQHTRWHLRRTVGLTTCSSVCLASRGASQRFDVLRSGATTVSPEERTRPRPTASNITPATLLFRELVKARNAEGI